MRAPACERRDGCRGNGPPGGCGRFPRWSAVRGRRRPARSGVARAGPRDAGPRGCCWRPSGGARRRMRPPAQLWVPGAPAAAVQGPSARLDGLARRYWTALLATTALPFLGGGPLSATSLGDHRFDAKLDELSPDAFRQLRQSLAELRTEAATLPQPGLPAEEQLTLEMLRRQLGDADALDACQAEVWVVDQLYGRHVALATSSSPSCSRGPAPTSVSGRFRAETPATRRWSRTTRGPSALRRSCTIWA